MRLFTILILITIVQFSFAQDDTLKASLNQTLTDFKNCMSSESKTVCEGYTSKALIQVFNISDFYNSTNQKEMSPFEIQQFVSKSSQWTKLGSVYQVDVLTKAQELSNAGKAVIVILEDDSPTNVHVSIVLPGNLQTSGSWGRRVPSVAAFFTHDPDKSFVDKSISYAYTKNMMLKLQVYARN